MRDAEHERCWTVDMRDTGKVECRTGGMQDWRDAGKKECRKGGMQERRDAGKERFKRGGIQIWFCHGVNLKKTTNLLANIMF